MILARNALQKNPRPGFELRSQIPFPTTIIVTLQNHKILKFALELISDIL